MGESRQLVAIPGQVERIPQKYVDEGVDFFWWGWFVRPSFRSARAGLGVTRASQAVSWVTRAHLGGCAHLLREQVQSFGQVWEEQAHRLKTSAGRQMQRFGWARLLGRARANGHVRGRSGCDASAEAQPCDTGVLLGETTCA